jgi:hypothetical protein
MAESAPAPLEAAKPPAPVPLDEIQAAIERIRFGSVQIIIQDGRVVQIDATEKKRLV